MRLFKCLDTYGFGEKFIRWIKILYSNIQSSILVNQFISEPLDIGRGVRQGCALSPLLYVLCLEPFANQVRLDNRIRGLPLPGSCESVKCVFYADDGTGTLTDLDSCKRFLEKSQLFGKASGSKLNVSKTRGMFLGKWKSRSDHPFGISWVESTKLLGNTLGNFISDDDIWSKTLGKIQKTLNNFKSRNMSFRSKSYVINSLALSKLWYLGSTNLISGHYLKLFEKSVFDFIWSYKAEPLKRETLYLPFNLGGQNLINISLKLDCLLLKHVINLISGSSAKWTFFATYWLGLYLRKYNTRFSSLNTPHSDFIPPFYKRCLYLLKQFNEITKNLELKNLSCKYMYRLLSFSHPYHPRIESVRPFLNFVPVWQTFQNKFVDPFSRDLSWRIVHEILPVQQLLCKYKISKMLPCNLCTAPLESISHLFTSCHLVQPLYKLVFGWISVIANYDILPSESMILYHTLPKNLNLNKCAKNVILCLLMDCKFAIWSCRNLKKFENRNINSHYITVFMLSRLKCRIEADYKRLSFQSFYNYWIKPMIFCDLAHNDDSKLDFYI